MRPMNLDAVKARLLGAPGRRDEIVAQLLHLGERQPARARLRIVGRAHRRADQLLGRPVARVVQLHRRYRTRRADRIGQLRQPFQLRIVEHAKLPFEALSHRLDMRRRRHGDAESALGAHRQPVMLFVGQPAIGMALLVGQRRQHETVLHRRPALQRQRFKQVVNGHPRLLCLSFAQCDRIRSVPVGWARGQ